MKKLLAVISAFMILCTAGCGTSSSSESAQVDTSSMVASADTNSKTASDDNSLGNDSGDMSQNRPNFEMPSKTVFGEVKSIAGNMVTLGIGELPDDIQEKMQNQIAQPNNAIGEKPDNASGERPDNATGERPTLDSETRAQYAQKFAGGKGAMAQGMFEDLEIELTGEVESYTIPVELSVGISDYTSITKGMIISVGLDENDEVIRVTILKS